MARFGARRAVPLGRIAAFVLAVATRAPAFAADDDLVAAAKREGHVTWYTTQIVDQLARPAAKAFQSSLSNLAVLLLMRRRASDY